MNPGWNHSLVRDTVVLILAASYLVGCSRVEFPSPQSTEGADLFTQTHFDKNYDLLWVIDNSPDLLSQRDHIRFNIGNFLRTLEKNRLLGYQMAMTTTDLIAEGGQLLQTSGGTSVVSKADTDPAAHFSELIGAIQDSSTSEWEQGLESSYRAIVNQGGTFLRSNAALAIIYVTNDDDYSCESGCTGNTPEESPGWASFGLDKYIDFFDGLSSADRSEVMIYPLVGTSSSSCAINNTGLRYLNLLQGLGGFSRSGSICSVDLPKSFLKIAEVLADRGARFSLSLNIHSDNFDVYVDGTYIERSPFNGYVYDALNHAVVFKGASVPPNGATILVRPN